MKIAGHQTCLWSVYGMGCCVVCSSCTGNTLSLDTQTGSCFRYTLSSQLCGYIKLNVPEINYIKHTNTRNEDDRSILHRLGIVYGICCCGVYRITAGHRFSSDIQIGYCYQHSAKKIMSIEKTNPSVHISGGK